MSRVFKKGVLPIIICLVAFVAIGSAWALPANPYSSVLTSSSGNYSDNLLARVTQIGNLYHYEYELAFTSSYNNTSPLQTLTIGNLDNLEFLNAGNDGGLANPTWGTAIAGTVVSTDSVLWASGTSTPVGRTVKFWYNSVYSYKEVTVVMKAGRLSNNGIKTLGMDPASVPEPGTLVALGMGLTGLGGMLIRRKK